ncbi:MAG: hypothetical protein ACOCWI_01630 [Bacillota bacterium]
MKKVAINELVKAINAKVVCMGDVKTLENGYCGDFLSFVISRIPDYSAWFTVMNNANVAGVAQLAEVGAIVICENIKADKRLKECCEKEKINLLETSFTSFECAVEMGKLLK